MGYLTLDTTDFTARVETKLGEPAIVRPGDIVLGIVNATRGSMAIVSVQAIATDPDRGIGGDTNGTLHVSKTSEKFLESMEDAFRVRDIIRARVLETDPAIQLTTKGPRLGVLKSWCPRCGGNMLRPGKGVAAGRQDQDARRNAHVVACPECDWKDMKKLAEDFGEGNVL
jgi:exosome complex component CSL4